MGKPQTRVAFSDRISNTGLGDAGLQSLVRQTRLLRHFILKMIILPRQSRDKHRESTQKKDAFLQARALPSLPRLRLLVLDENPCIGAPGWSALSTSLPSMPVLDDFHAAGCTGTSPVNISAKTAETSAIRVS
jgi:hypothetical protein